MKRVSKQTRAKSKSQSLSASGGGTQPFIEHLHELRRRLFYVAISVGIFSGGAYAIEHHIVDALLKPAHGQKFIYTSPGGGIDFLFRVCIYTGVAASIPIIVYQFLRYLEPLIKRGSLRFVALGSAISGVLALAGMAFGYFIGLPAALHFLLHQFVTRQIEPLLTIQSYMSFVTVYMLGSAMLFQLPLILIFINRIKPLKPQKLFKMERWVILFAFLSGGLLNPSPHIIDQLLLAGPMIVMYQVGILLIYLINKGDRPKKRITTLKEQDASAQAERIARAQIARALVPLPSAQGVVRRPQPVRRTMYADGLIAPRRPYQSLRPTNIEGAA